MCKNGLYRRFIYEYYASATNILDPDTYYKIEYVDVTQHDMKKCENWFFNYALTLLLSEFEKHQIN